jgi:hypothetical protein
MRKTPESSGRRSSGPAFETSTARTVATRNAKSRLLVCCNALKTEKDYLQGLKDHLETPAVTVRFKPKVCSPSQLVDFAIAERARQAEEFDQVWCVFDVDQYPDVATAVAKARREDVEIALSNPCFEIWLILHFVAHTAPADTYKALLPMLKKHVKSYDKTRLNFKDYRDGWPDAVGRARGLASAGQEHRHNPSTGVWRLVQDITGDRSGPGLPAQRGRPSWSDCGRGPMG